MESIIGVLPSRDLIIFTNYYWSIGIEYCGSVRLFLKRLSECYLVADATANRTAYRFQITFTFSVFRVFDHAYQFMCRMEIRLFLFGFWEASSEFAFFLSGSKDSLEVISEDNWNFRMEDFFLSVWGTKFVCLFVSLFFFIHLLKTVKFYRLSNDC